MYEPIRRQARRGVLVALVSTGVAVMIAAGSGQQQTPGQGAAPAQGGGRGGGNFASNFTGKVVVGDSTDMRTSRIRFEAGARTNWHLHSAGQLLLVEEGRGRLYEQGGDIVELRAGQPVYTKPNVLHWHGAAPDSHALQFSVYSGMLEWKEAVADDEYLGKKKR
jgi:quercetin dioxygenase-like cupin family protein